MWKGILDGLLCLTSGALVAWAGSEPLSPTPINEPYRITCWTSDQGLPQNTVNALCQTHDGYLWIGTRYGLARYDGARFVDYSAALSQSDEDDLDVRALVEDDRGRLWLSTGTGLVCYHEGRFTRPAAGEPLLTGAVETICDRRAGGLWVARHDALFEYHEGKVGRCFRFGADILSPPIEEHPVDRVIEDDQGFVWFRIGSLRSGHWFRLDPATGAVRSLDSLFGTPMEAMEALRPDRHDRLWMATQGALMCWEGGRPTRYAASGDWDPGQHTKDMVVDARGIVWVTTWGAVQLHRLVNGQFASYGLAQGLFGTDDVRTVLADREGNVWVGTGSHGLYRLHPWQLVSMLTGSESTLDEVYSVAPGKEGRVWLATTYGVVQYQAGQFTVHTNREVHSPYSQGVVKRVRPVIETRSGEVLFGLDFEGLCRLHGNAFDPVPVVETEDGKPTRKVVRSLCEDAGGTLWIASYRGLVQKRGAECRQWTTSDGLSDTNTSGLVAAGDGTLWVGTRNGGVNRFKDGHFRVYSTNEGLLSAHAWPLRWEPDGSMWVGTPVGLNRIRGSEVRAVTRRQGLFDNLAYCLIEDRRSNYWSFCNRGIWRVDKADLHAAAEGRIERVYCVKYGQADGMTIAEGNGDDQPNAALLPNGELWFPTTRGVVIVDLDRLRGQSVPPPVVIEEVRVDEETVYRDGGYLTTGKIRKAADKPLALPPGRARVLEVRYTATTFSDAEETRFRYRLAGAEDRWREVDTRRMAIYTNLRPGRYRFLVEACNRHGEWSAKTAEFAFSLQPRFTETWPFYGLCGLALAGVAAGWHRNRLRLQRLEQQHALEDERRRIAKDLHDDLGASLTGIALQMEVARQTPACPPLVQETLESLAASVRTTVDRMREVIWTINPRCDRLESVCAYLCQHAEHYLGAADLRCRLDTPDTMPAVIVSAETRHHLLLVMKEALNNIVKHAQATEVNISLQAIDGGLALCISDDGRGFVPPSPIPRRDAPGAPSTDRLQALAGTPGHGLTNMRWRIHALGGRFELDTAPGKGTRITVHVPLARRR